MIVRFSRPYLRLFTLIFTFYLPFNLFALSVTAQPVSNKIVIQSSHAAADKTVIQRTEQIIREVIKDSYPELANTDIRVQPFASKSDYFRTTFSYQRFLFGAKMRYF